MLARDRGLSALARDLRAMIDDAGGQGSPGAHAERAARASPSQREAIEARGDDVEDGARAAMVAKGPRRRTRAHVPATSTTARFREFVPLGQ